MDAEVLIVGGGIAGLSAALALREQGRQALLLEASDEVGGHFRAEASGGYLFPRGPHAIPGFASEAFDLVERLGLSARLIAASASAKRWVWLRGRRVALPTGPASFLGGSFLSLRGKLRLLSEPWRGAPKEPDPHESVADFFGRRLGDEALRSLVAPFVSGIYAGDADRLEARAAFPRLVGWERARGSLVRGALAERRPKARRGLWSLPGGLAEIASAATASLGEVVRRSSPVRALVRERAGWLVETETEALRAKRVVLAVPPPSLSRLLEELDAEAAALAALVPMAPVAVVHLGGPLRPGARPCQGFGLLVPREAGLRTLGIVFASSLFPGRAPEGCWLQASYLGGVFDPSALELDDEALRELVSRESRKLLGFEPDGGVLRVVRHRSAIPQLVPGHVERVAALEARLAAFDGLSVCGAWMSGVGLQHAIASGRRAAAQVAP